MLLRIYLFFCLMALGGCASTHNLKTDGTSLLGGGFREDELGPGLYKLTAKSNMSIWPNFEAASETWKMRADALCGKDAYISFETDWNKGGRETPSIIPVLGDDRITFIGGGTAHTYNSSMHGYVLCNSSHMTVAEAKDFLRAQQEMAQQEANKALQAELDETGGDNCLEPEPGISGEVFFRRGKALFALKRYPDARACFVQAQQVENDPYIHKESCESLGLMYEIGLGVEKNLQEAQKWYRKAEQ